MDHMMNAFVRRFQDHIEVYLCFHNYRLYHSRKILVERTYECELYLGLYYMKIEAGHTLHAYFLSHIGNRHLESRVCCNLCRTNLHSLSFVQSLAPTKVRGV